MDSSIETLSSYAASLSYKDLTVTAIKAAKHRMIDTIGCALGGYTAEPCKIARRLCFPTGAPLTSRVIGSLFRTSPEMAAFANGTMLRYLDFNDAYRAKDAGHPSDAIAAVLAMGEAVHADGKALITAIVLAYEVQCLIIEETLLDAHGWDQPVYVVLGAAMGVGTLLGLSKEQLGNAAALALIPNMAMYQNRVGELSMWKAAAAGMAARQGIFAAVLAREGMTGAEEAIDGQYGLKNQVTGPFSFDILGGNGRPFRISRTNIKTYPVRDSCQLVAMTARDFRKQVAAEEIESLNIKTVASSYKWAVEPKELWAPQTRETADHSIPFTVAAMLIDGDITPQTFSRERFLDADILDLLGRMHAEPDPEFSKQTPAVRNFLIEATTKSGEKRVAHGVLTAEQIEEGKTDEETTAKFVGLARDVLTPSQIEATLDLLWDLENLDDAEKIVDNLAV